MTEERELRACYHWTEWERKAKELEQKTLRLKEQIEKMKHCITCKYYLDWRVDCEEKRDCEPSTMKHWELKE